MIVSEMRGDEKQAAAARALHFIERASTPIH
jgi:hypothetical protein